MVDKNDSLFREIEEELRRERLAKFWDKYGVYVIGLGAAILAAIGGYQLWHGRQVALANEGGTLYESAVRLTGEGKTDEALKEFGTLSDGGHRGYASLAALQSAGADLKAGKADEALVQFDKVAKDQTADPLLKSFAALQAASLRLGKADLPEMQNRLNDLAADGNPWRHYARELLGLAAYKAGDIVAASKEFDRILSDTGAPQGVMARVRVLMGQIMADTLAKAKPAAEAAPSGGTKPDGAAAGNQTPADAPKADAKDGAAPPAEKK
jgi:hypothetical protein